MKMLFTGLMFFLLPFFSPSASIDDVGSTAPLSENKFVQFYVIGMTEATKAREINAFMRQQPNILVSRADPNTRIYFAIFPETAGYNQEAFTALFNGLGYQIACYREGVQGIDQPYSKENYRCD